jgi:hypothetical protein
MFGESAKQQQHFAEMTQLSKYHDVMLANAKAQMAMMHQDRQDAIQSRLEMAMAQIGARQQQQQRIPVAQATKLANLAGDSAGTMQVMASFKPEYAGGALVTPLKNYAARYGLGSDKAKEAAQWWSDYEKMFALPERHAMFGSAFTETEKNAWRAANITPNMTAEQITTKLATLHQIIKNHTVPLVRALNRTYNPAEVQDIFGSIVPEEFSQRTAPQAIPQAGGEDIIDAASLRQ